jgi:hypothetical protein
MTGKSDPSAAESLRSGIQARHPDIAHEIQGAINTLRNLHNLARLPEGERQAGHGAAVTPGDSSATTDGTHVPK